MAIELVIFDCDGVLVDSEEIANQILAKHLTALGIPINAQESVERFCGRSLKSCIELVEMQLGARVPGDFVERLQEETFQRFRYELCAVPGIKKLLEQLTVRSCVASSGTHEKMALTLKLTGLYGFFPGRLFSASEVARGKPYPDLFLHASERMCVSPQNCVVIEDSPVGVQAARAAGMRVFGYAGRTRALLLEEAGAEPFVAMSELQTLLMNQEG
jgi:HAD superfamily hydrolase (TIGR01509 family)